MHDMEKELIHLCIELGEQAASAGDVPIGALVCDADGQVIAEGFNVRERWKDPSGHAEIVALRKAAQAIGRWNLSGCTLAVNLEPCTMCAGAIVNAHVSRVVFGAWDPKAGAAGSVRDVLRDQRLPHRVEVMGGVLEAECARRLSEWFAQLRTQ